MMELGALVCTPKQPKCLVCPVVGLCEAAKRGIAEQLPVKVGRKAPMAVRHHIVAIERGEGFLFQQRPSAGLWSNMWQLPTAETLPLDADGAIVGDWVRERTGLAITRPRELERFSHQTTHRTITFVLWRAAVEGGRLARHAGVWRKPQAIDDLPLANPQRRAVQMLLG
jgi:A/G-specific adenine glycosylase